MSEARPVRAAGGRVPGCHLAWLSWTSSCWPPGEPTLGLTPRASELASASASASNPDSALPALRPWPGS